MKTELHCHTNRYSMCSTNTPEEMLARLIEAEYDVVFITEHNQVWSEGELQKLRRQFPKIKILPGVELTLYNPEGFAHMLVLGTNDPDFLGISEAVEILTLAEEQKCLTVLAHPFRFDGADWPSRGDAKKLPDAIEYFSPNVDSQLAEQARHSADQLGIGLVNSGDVHSIDFIDKFWIETNHPFENAAKLREIILNGDYENFEKE